MFFLHRGSYDHRKKNVFPRKVFFQITVFCIIIFHQLNFTGYKLKKVVLYMYFSRFSTTIYSQLSH